MSRIALAGLIALLFLHGGPLALAQAPAPAAQADIEINRGVIAPLPIAIPAFGGAGPHGAEMAQVIAGNLERSGLFAPVDPARYGNRTVDGAVWPSFAEWRELNARYLVTGLVAQQSERRLSVQFRLWDVASETQIAAVEYGVSEENWRRAAHKISDAIYERLTGEPGYFDTRIVFVAESGPKTARILRLTIMDQDGWNPSYLTDGSSMVFTPRFSANSQEITYMELRETGAQLYLFNIETGRRESLGRYPGMVFAPRFSPDGGKVAFSVERAGNSDVWMMELASRTSRRITTDPGIDTSPSFSPDGRRIVFNSDRGGSPQLYVMNEDGSGARRISQGGGRYSTPVWSPKGDLIAFTKQVGGQFHIGVMRPDGSDERLLTASYLDEGPTWAPNGRVLMFFRETVGGTPRLWTVDVTGRIVRPAAYQGAGSDPAWSPLLD